MRKAELFPPKTGESSRRLCWSLTGLGGVAIVVATVLAYLPALQAGFIWDDDTFLVKNSLIHQADGLYRFWFTAQALDYFPLTSTSLWLEWRLWGPNPFGYHFTNVLLHAASALLWWRVLARLRIPGAWLAAAVFALHPVNVESVAWITERKNTLSMFFYALALLLYLRFDSKSRYRQSVDSQPSTLTPKRRYYWLSLVAFLLSLLAKTSAVMLPCVLLLCVWWQHRRIQWRDWVETAPFFLASLALGLITVWFQYHRAIGLEIVRADNLGSRLAVAGWAVWFYLSKALLPLNLMFVYPRWQTDAETVLSFVPGFLFGALLLVCWAYRRCQWGRAGFFGLSYFVVMLLPVLGFLDIYFMRFSLVADHWQYFSIIGIIALVTGTVTSSFKLPTCNFLVIPPVILLGILTWRQCGTYRDLETLWRDTLVKNPACWMAHNNLGVMLMKQGKQDEAIVCFTEALRIKPDFSHTHFNLGIQLERLGKLNEAIRCYSNAVRFKPAYPDAYNNLGSVLAQVGSFDEAVAHFQQALHYRPNYADALVNLGKALMKLGRTSEAEEPLMKAILLKPTDADAHYHLGRAYAALKRTREAIGEYEAALRLNPNDGLTHYQLADLLHAEGNVPAAEKHYRAALAVNANYPEAHYQLATILVARQELAAGIKQYQEAVRLKPDWVEALNNLAWILATNPNPHHRDGMRAVALAARSVELSRTNDCETLDTLAASYAEAGQFTEAVKISRQARALAEHNGLKDLASQIQNRQSTYESGKPWRQ